MCKLESQLEAKELERNQAATERNRLEKELADQASQHAEQLQQLKDGEERLKAEFESQRSSWSDKEKYLMEGYLVIEDLLEGKASFFLDWLVAGYCGKSASYSLVFF